MPYTLALLQPFLVLAGLSQRRPASQPFACSHHVPHSTSVASQAWAASNRA